MRWVIVGARGMLGTDMVAGLGSRGHDVIGLGRGDIDITDPTTLGGAFTGADVIVNCAAWTAVDAAESAAAEAFAVNAVGAANVARAAHREGARLVHISTDYVFDGSGSRAWAEDDPMAPLGEYGRTKAAGEWAVRAYATDSLVVRTAWLYGAAGPCFPRTVARLVAERGGIDVVDDQTGQPTWTVDLVALVERLVGADAPAGTYHGTSSGSATWFEFARAVIAAARRDPETVRPTSSDHFVRPAPRPSWSVLGHASLEALGIEPIGDWRERWTAAASTVLRGQDLASSPSR